MPKKKATKKTNKKNTITLGVLQHEIDEIIEDIDNSKTNKQLQSKVASEIKDLLPREEKLTKKRNSSNIVITSTEKRATHSPYVLDLKEMIDEKQKKDNKKQRVRNFFVNKKIKSNKHVARSTKHEPEEEQTIIFAEHENAVLVKESPPKSKKKESRHKQFTKTPLFYHFNLPRHWERKLIAYATLCLILVIPIKGFSYYKDLQQTQEQVVEYANSAYQDLKIASESLSSQNLDEANENFEDAKNNFELAEDKLNSVNIVLKTILKVVPTGGATLADAEYLLDAGEQISGLGQKITKIYSDFSNSEEKTLIEKIEGLQWQLETVIAEINEVNNNLNKINLEAIPEDKRESFVQAKKYLATINADLQELNSLSNSLFEVLGKNYKRRYLFVFQNNNELRATGGFMGSFALVDIDRGEIKNIEIPGGGTYDLQGQLLENVISPYPLHLVNSRWEFQDSNWFPDFPTSAKKIKWFYEKAGGPTVDGVIAINVSLMPDLLEAVGPIDMPEYGKTLTATNFTEETQKAVEFEYDKLENKPKQIISDMAPKILDKVFSAKGENLVKVVQSFKKALTEKDIQMYFVNEPVQEKFSDYNWTGEIKNTSKDYLSIVNTNIRGYKTDAYINQDFDLVSNINSKGEVTNTLTITREHTGSKENTFESNSNIDYLRVYVPQGSTLISAKGFSDIPASAFEAVEDGMKEDELLRQIQGKIWIEPGSKTFVNNEFNKTVFGNWIQTDPGETQTVTIEYKLPFTVKLPDQKTKPVFNLLKEEKQTSFYSLFLQKQSGIQNTNYSFEINLPNNTNVNWLYPATLTKQANQIKYKTKLNQDELIAFVLE